MPTVTTGQVAIFYSVATGALLGKLVNNDVGRSITFTVPQGQAIIIQETALPYDDASCYALISQVTGLTVNEQTDRCAVLDTTGTVIAVHKRDPSILPAQPGEAQLILHPFADVGDTLAPNGKDFQRRCVHVLILPPQAAGQAHSGQVDRIDNASVTASGQTLPAAADKAHFVLVSKTLQVGDKLDLGSVPPGIAEKIAASGV